MHDDIVLILMLSLVIWLSPFISKLLKIPTAPVEIIIGSIMAYFGLLYENDFFSLIAEVGFLYLMFLAGMEVNLEETLQGNSDTLKKSFIFVFLLGVLAVISGLILQFDPIVIISLPLISIGLLASLIKVYGKKEPWLKLAVSVGVVGEMMSIIALTAFDAASTVGFGWELFAKLGYLVIFLIAIVLIYKMFHLLFWWYPELKSSLMPLMDISDRDTRFAMALFFIMISLMLYLHLELALGAFIAGVAISAFFHYNKSLEEKMSSLGFGFLVPIFFIHVGVSFDLNAIFMDGVLSGALLITGVMIAIRVLAAFPIRNIINNKLEVLIASISLGMPLTLLIAVATIGYDSGSIKEVTYYQLILASLIEVLVVMFLIKILRPKPDFRKSSDI